MCQNLEVKLRFRVMVRVCVCVIRIAAHHAGRLCPIRDINKNGRRNRREDSTPKFFIRSFINGNANSFYLTLQIRSLLRNDSFRLHRQTRPEIYHFPRHTKNTLVKKPVMKTVHFELRLGFKWLPRSISKFSPCIFVTPSQNLYVQQYVIFGAQNSTKTVDITRKEEAIKSIHGEILDIPSKNL